MVITTAATGDSQVKALVYDDAYLPAQTETLEDLTKAGSCFAVPDLSTVFTFVPFPGAPSGVADAYGKQSVFPGCFANGLPASEAAVLAATQRPLASSTFTDQSGVPAWQTIPSWDMIGTADHIITPAEQITGVAGKPVGPLCRPVQPLANGKVSGHFTGPPPCLDGHRAVKQIKVSGDGAEVHGQAQSPATARRLHRRHPGTVRRGPPALRWRPPQFPGVAPPQELRSDGRVLPAAHRGCGAPSPRSSPPGRRSAGPGAGPPQRCSG